MITGAHTILYADDAEAARAFFRDVLGFPAVDAGGGWLIFALPPGELALHPGASGTHRLHLMCDDLEGTMAELAGKGVALGPVHQERWGRVTTIEVPGAGQVGLYEPSHPQPPQAGG
jgi:catechol 2,3-dioxygenase-like lactoylglutathione lyase family enzyme